MPLMTFTLKMLDKDANETLLHKEEDPVIVSFEDTIDGFREGVRGMKEGEERTLYIHPELAYGEGHRVEEPNKLIIIEVKLLE